MSQEPEPRPGNLWLSIFQPLFQRVVYRLLRPFRSVTGKIQQVKNIGNLPK